MSYFVTLFKVYNFTPTQVSLFMAVMGLGFGAGTGFLVNYVARIFTLRQSFIYFTLATAIMIYLIVIIHSPLFSWLIVAPLACCISTAYTCVLTLFSNQVDEKSQGWVMGITGSIMAFVWAVNGIAVGIVAAFHDKYPLFISSIFLFITVIATYFLFPEPKNEI